MISPFPYNVFGEPQREHSKEEEIGMYCNFPYFLAQILIEGKDIMANLNQIYIRVIIIAICIITSGYSNAETLSNRRNNNLISETILLENNAPVTQNDTVALIKNSSVNIYILENDYDLDGSEQIDPASIQIVKYPNQGTITIDTENGIILYTAVPNYNQKAFEDFEYVVYDYDGNVSNSSKVQITIITNRNWAPDAFCKDTVLYLDENGTAEIHAIELDAGSSSNYPQVDIVRWLANRRSILILTCSEKGDNDVILTVTDGAYLSQTCTANVTVYDTISPTLYFSPGTVYACADQGAEVNVFYDVPLFSDNCDGSGLEGVLIDGKSSGSSFPIGTSKVTYSYTDSSGNGPVICSFKVHVYPKPLTGSIFSIEN